MSNSTPPIPKAAKRARRSDSEIEDDRLSDLPDCILLHILSFLEAKYAVQTCILSTRWKNLWKCLQTLILHSRNFSTLKSFTKFVSKVLTLRDGSTALHQLDLERHGSIEPHIIKRIVNYAVSSNVQRLGIRVDFDMLHLLPCIFTCHTLTSLKLQVHHRGGCNLFPNSLNLPALTNLHLANFAFCGGNDGAEPFSAFNRLNSLIIEGCKVEGRRTLCISSMTLVNLTLRCLLLEFIKIELYTPCLHSFSSTGMPMQHITGVGLSTVQEANIDAHIHPHSIFPPRILHYWLRDLVNIRSLTVTTKTLHPHSIFPPRILHYWLRDLVNIRSLTVTTKTLQVLSSIPDILETIPLSWANLKRLKIKRTEAGMLSNKLPEPTAAPIRDTIVDLTKL